MALSADILRGYTDTIILHQLSYGGKLVENCVQAIARDCLALSIDRLEAAGLIQSYWGSETSGARRRYYAITALGQEKLISDLAAWEDTKRQLDQLLEG